MKILKLAKLIRRDECDHQFEYHNTVTSYRNSVDVILGHPCGHKDVYVCKKCLKKKEVKY